MIEILFWSAVFLLVYTYALYPLLLKFLVAEKSVAMVAPDAWPAVDVVLSAYNEEACIKARIENLLASDYPGELTIRVASDGSVDNTPAILSTFNEDPRVDVNIHTKNRGKVSVLNELVANCQANVLIFTDANTEFTADTITKLVASFTPNVGAVCGELHLYNPDGNDNNDSLYWRYEQFLKKRESSMGSLLGANGAVYAIRRELYQPLPSTTVVDDFCIVMNVKKQGYDVIYNDHAVAHEEVAPSLHDEFGRRVRIGLGNYRAFFANLWALSPLRLSLALSFFSHKVLRWFAPHLMLLALVTNIVLIHQPFYALVLFMQLLFYTVAVYGLAREKCGLRNNALVAIITFFVSMNLALAQGFIKFLGGGQSGAWKTTARQGENK
ncbi:glycosyltransferase family 2 protein [Alteromonas flava]|uniref:glycosyltransferase family 2 protein n=1 Tax=Alteromonas flava TaxID=2048003 RepID=UPI001F0C8DCC|nr:glycosyltransferase family 2 protein [Alteromonas flava]